MIISGLIIGGLSIYASIKTHKTLNNKELSTTVFSKKNDYPRKKSLALKHRSYISSDKNNDTTITQASASKNFSIASASLGFVVAGHILFAPLALIGIGGLAYLVYPTWKRAYYDVTQKRRFTRMVLESMVLPATLLTGQYFAAAIAYWFLYFALNMVAKAKGRTTQNLAEVFITPSNRIVYIMRDGAEVEMTLKDVQVGDTLIIGAGEIIPADGTIIEGSATVDQRLLTGEAQLVEKQKGDLVFAATMLLTGRILVDVEKAGEQTIASQTSQVLNKMTTFTNTLELRSIDTADRLALPYLALGSAASLLTKAGNGLAIFWAPLDDALYAAGPLGVLNYLNIALRRGILIKDGRALETLRQVDTIVFDKTGTLTEETPSVVKVHTCQDMSEQDILRYAAAAEHKQMHPIALAILAAASAQNIDIPTISEAAYEIGHGLKVIIDDHTVRVGSHRFMEQQALPLPEALQTAQDDAHQLGYSLVYVAVDDVIVGAIELHTTVRANTVATITKLKQFGYKIYIISGDHEKPTQYLAQQLGIDHYFAEILPEGKANLLKKMQQNGQVVCYVGDGINDTIALKQAEVSISLRGASTIATDTAQVVLMNGQLDQLVELIEIAKSLDATYKATVVASAIPTAVIIGGVFTVHLTLATAIVYYVAGMGLSISNAMLPLLNEFRRNKK